MAEQEFIIVGDVLKKYTGKGGKVVIPDGVREVDYFAFSDCGEVTELIIPETFRDSLWDEDDTKKLRPNKYDNAYYLGTEDNPYFLLYKAKNREITSCEIHKDTKVIGHGAFALCKNLESLVIHDGVIYVDSSVCFWCDGLKRLTIGRGVEEINTAAFAECRALEEVIFNAERLKDLTNENDVFKSAGLGGDGVRLTIGKNVLRIPEHLCYPNVDYEYYPKFTHVEFEDGSLCESIGVCAFFSCSYLKHLKLGENIKLIDRCAFKYCHALCSLTIPDSVERLEYMCFAHADHIRELKFGAGLKYIGEGAFYDILFFEGTVEIPDSVEEIAQYAFKDCANVSEVVLGSGVSVIGESAFNNCYRMKQVNLPKSLREIGEDAFGRCIGLKTASFEKKSGWVVGDTKLSADELRGVKKSAALLSQTYCKEAWFNK